MKRNHECLYCSTVIFVSFQRYQKVIPPSLYPYKVTAEKVLDDVGKSESTFRMSLEITFGETWGSPTVRIENHRLRGTNGHSKRSGEKKANLS